jgi:hypothetical protein
MQLKDVEKRFYSQNGEDGIIAHLIDGLTTPGTKFVEIGCGSGKENNTTHLVKSRGWSGFVYDAKGSRIKEYRERGFKDVRAEHMLVTPENALEIVLMCATPDVFSLDIDSTDWHVLKAMLQAGFRPRIAVLEYNATFMELPYTVPARMRHSVKDVYFGASVTAWVRLMSPFGYEFVTVDSAGVNAVFVKKGECAHTIEGLLWADCRTACERFGPAKKRFESIRHLPLEVATP